MGSSRHGIRTRGCWVSSPNTTSVLRGPTNRFNLFQAENDLEREEWMSVLLNSKEAALNAEFQNNGQTNVNQCFLELQRTLVSYIRALPGNERCCDCDSTNGNGTLASYRTLAAIESCQL